ncbi:hypothetical protein [Paenibacillus sp. GCM10027626]|uniref:hypothetical protein n=1 Tax=Paenibacillus sp. GCM10027626 TaxID=3273411 RepID=UPI00362B51B7
MRLRRGGITRLMFNDEGAVSIYLTVSTAAIFLFVSMLIDYARIAALQKQVELSAYSGLRSALSAFDGELYSRYALFGAGGSDRNELFKQAVHDKRRSADADQAFSIVRMNYEHSHVQPYETLGWHDVFMRQVLEEMKYKAPIDFTIEVAAKFAPVASAMKEASAAVNTLEKIRKVYDKREQSLSKVLGWQQEAAKATGKSAALIPFRVQDAMSGESAASIAGGYAAYREWVAHDANPGKDEQPLYSQLIFNYEQSARKISSELQRSAEGALQRHRELEAKIAAELERAEMYNEQMREIIHELRSEQAGGGFDRVSGQNIPGGSPDALSADDAAQIRQAAQSAEQLLLPAGWFATYSEEWQAQVKDTASYSSEAAGFQNGINAALGGYGSEALLVQRAAQLRIAYEQYDRQYANNGTVIGRRVQEREARISHDEERKRQEKKAKSKWGEVRAILHNITSIPQLEEHQQMFDAVQNRFTDNLRFNQLSDEAAQRTDNAEEPGDAAGEAIASMGKMFDGMADMLAGARDRLYTNEYVIQRFTTFDPRKLGAVLQNKDSAEFSHALSLNNQEAEYILYGFHSPSANIAAAYGELFAVRLAIRTMEGLIECQKMGHPLLILAGALVYGLEQALADLLSLVHTGSTPLSKYAKINITYQEYLRLFLLLHGSGGSQRISRIIAVIEHNTGMNLTAVETGLSAEVTASIKLWFVPGLIRAAAGFGLLSGKVTGNRYEATRTIGLSYS